MNAASGHDRDWYATRQTLRRQLGDAGTDVVAWANLAYAELRCGDPNAAETAARRALQLDPRHTPAWINLGASHLNRRHYPAAAEAAATALSIDPNDASSLLFAGQVERDQGQISKAFGYLLQATRSDPAHATAWAQLALIQMELGLGVQAMNSIQRALQLEPGRTDFHSNRLMIAQYHPGLDSSALRDLALKFGRSLNLPVLPQPGPQQPGPLRVAYLSPDLRAHPVGYVLRDVLPRHQPERIQASLWHLQVESDWLTDELRQSGLAWHEVGGLSDQALAEALRAEDIDVLVDLAGHTAYNRLGVTARRPARVQCSFLGWFGAIGVPGLDAVLIGAEQLAEGHESTFAEPVQALPGCHFRYRRLPHAPPAEADEAPLPLKFGCFNNTAKFHGELIDCWAEILSALPDAVLELRWKTLADQQVRTTLARRFSAVGVDPERLLLHGACPHRELLAAYSKIHIALDPFPFSGGMSSLEALSMGVPIITLAQLRPVSRQTHAMLTSLGLASLSTSCAADYVATAVELARDHERRRQLRRHLAANYDHSPLADGATLARALESAYEALLTRLGGV